MKERMGDVLRDGDRVGLRFERRLRHLPDKVWRALTESEHRALWMPTDIVGERRAGASIDLPFWPEVMAKYSVEAPSLSGEILVWDPPRTFEWTWDTDHLRWELEPIEEGTLLRFTTWFGDPASGSPQTAAGYHICLDHLIELLDTGTGHSVADADTAAWESRYGELTFR